VLVADGQLGEEADAPTSARDSQCPLDVAGAAQLVVEGYPLEGGALPDWVRIRVKRRLARLLVEKWGERSPAERARLEEAVIAYAMRESVPAGLGALRTLDDIGRWLAPAVDPPRAGDRLPSWQGRP
jgi:hypothetical protein